VQRSETLGQHAKDMSASRRDAMKLSSKRQAVMELLSTSTLRKLQRFEFAALQISLMNRIESHPTASF
jgi:hypothetical protein